MSPPVIRQPNPHARRIGSKSAAVALLSPLLLDLAQERLCVAFLGRRLELLRTTYTSCCLEGRVEGSVREIMREALGVDARALILGHNHPRATPEPSPADRLATRRLVEVGRVLGVRLIDHLLFAGAEVLSFRELGLL